MQDTRFPTYRRVALVGGLAAFLVLAALPTPAGLTPAGQRTAAVAVLMAVWWITEALPIPATALLPLALFPLLGVTSAQATATAYGDRNIYLFAGGFFIAMAMQKWDLHERIALHVIHRAGTNPRRLILGFILATAFLSMWIANTATALMILPIGLGVIEQIDKTGDDDRSAFAPAVLLGIAYAASIGGMGTLIGTPTNIVLAAQMETLFPGAPEITYVQWLLIGLPVVVLFLPAAWWLLTRVLFHIPATDRPENRRIIEERLAALGPMSRGERIVLAVACCTALSWIFRENIDLGFTTIPGWSNLLAQPDLVHDGTVAIFFSVVLFLTPVDLSRGEFALDWDWALRIPWGILILFGGGLALAKGFQDSGLVEWIGGHMHFLAGAPLLVVVISVTILMMLLTEMTSNTAVTTVMLPILAVTATRALGVHPLLLMLPATLSASCAFMLPVATPPNAIVFASGRLTIAQMARAGVLLDLIGVFIVTAVTWWVAIPVFGITPGELPAWAR